MTYKILFCTLATGREYNGYAQRLYHSVQKVFGSPVLVVTDNPSYYSSDKYNNLITVQLPSHFKTKNIWSHDGVNYNYNLKYLPIKYARDLKSDAEFIFYMDCDWFVTQNKSLQKFHNNINHIRSNPQLDGIAARDLRIFHEKASRMIIPHHKLHFYNLFDTDKWDQAQIVNEQFLLLKNTPKLETFTNKWSELEAKCSSENGTAYAEGLEIGMSALEAEMNFHILNTIGDVFTFFSNKCGKYYEV